MAVTATFPLPYGTTTPLDQTGGAYIDRGSLVMLSAQVTAGTGTCYLYLWWPEVSQWRLYAENGMQITNGFVQGRYQMDLDQSAYWFLLTPIGVTLANPLIKGSRST
jgi:hypothetical protein